MGSSPESSKPVANSSSSPLPKANQTQDSPIFTYISNLSPIKANSTAAVVQEFPGINSPPFVLRSPQINSSRQQNCVKRAQFSQLSDTGLSREDENAEDTDTVAKKSGTSSTRINSGSEPSPKKEILTKNSAYAKESCPPGCADDYISVIVSVDDGAFASSAHSSPKRSDGIFHSQNDLLHSEDSVKKNESRDDPAKDELAFGEPPVILEQVGEDDLRNSVSNIKSFESVQTSQEGVKPRDVSEETRPDSCVNHSLDNEHGGLLEAENTGSGNLFEMCFTSQLGCMKTAQDSRSCENSVSITAAIEEKMHYHSTKVGQHQHGISRRLQFEDAYSKMMDIGFEIPSGSAGYPRSLSSRANPEVLESASLYKPVSPNNMLLASMNQAMFYPQNSENYNFQVPKRSGIGLHLNSIVAVENNAGMKVSIKSAESGNFVGIGKKSAPIMSSHLRENCSLSSDVVEGASVRNNLCDTRALTGASSVKSPHNMKSFYESVRLNPVRLNPVQLQSNLSNKRMCDTENFDRFCDFSLSSPKRKRKKSADAGDSNGCKRCNCKKTQCLKLYCDCFAAGIYCEDPCACQGCFNRPEYEDTVLGTRQQIESRNPTAFAAKTVPVNEPLANVCVEDGNLTPSSSRHKRGCNCKKSKCLKKYCECYQANVGCFDGCRCEGCDNVYGQKGDYGTNKDLVSKHRSNEKLDSSYEMMLKMVPSKDHLENELYGPHNLTPVTPPFQNSNRNAMGASRTWISSGRYLQSPESDLNLISPCQLPAGPSKIPEHRNTILETDAEILDLVPFHQDLDFGHGHIANQFSPRCDGPSNVGHFAASGLPNPLDWANASRVQITSGNRHVSSSGSLLWRSSTTTQSTDFGATKLSEVRDFDDGLYRIKGDDTPEILKENPMPPNTVKVSSPNKKRVSPPHVRRLEPGSCSSAGLKRCIKVTLKSVPEFPPRTPCIEFQGDPGQNGDNSLSSSGSK